MRRTPGLVVVFAAALAAATLAPGATAAPAQVRGYVVVLEDGAGAPAAVAAQLANRYGGEVGYVYRYALRGFYVRTTDRAAAAMASSPRVDYVEAESPVSVDEQTTPTGVARTSASSNANIGINGTGAGVDVDVAVLDTGIDLDHPDLAVAGSVSCVNVSSASACTGTGDDVYGHGTHVAGTIAARDNAEGVVGVAPGARLWSVKVLGDGGSGSNAGVAAGLDWVTARAGTIEVANLSLGGSFSTVMNTAVANATTAGVSVVVAAGNDSKDAGGYSPASAPSAITVSALADFNGAAGGGAAWTCYPDVDDTFANFSNYGQVVDIIAPGMCILSTIPGGYGTKSGTSMASPHVAGAAALLRSAGRSRTETESLLKSEGNFAWSGDRDSWKEPLLDVSDAGVFDPQLVGETATPPNAPPTASFTYACTDLRCSFVGAGQDTDGTVTGYSWSFGDTTTGTGQSADHTYGAAGAYTVTLTVTDNAGATGSTTQTVTVSAPSTGTPTYTPTSSRNGKSSWKATISVSNAAANTPISGTWNNNGTTSSGGCTTGSTGTCSFSLTKISNSVGSVTWTPTGGTAVTVLKP